MKKIFLLVVALATYASTALAQTITLPLNEDFSSMTNGSHDAATSTMPAVATEQFAWAAECTGIFDAGGMILIGGADIEGSFTTLRIAATKDSIIVEFDAIGWGDADENLRQLVMYGTGGGNRYVKKGTWPIAEEQFEHFRYAFLAETTAAVTIRNGNPKSRFFLKNLKITEKNGGGVFTDKNFLDFGDVNVGESKTLELTITPKLLSGVIEWTLGEGYTIDNKSEGTLEDYETVQTIQVTFSPTEVKNYRGPLTFTTDGKDKKTVTLFANGIEKTPTAIENAELSHTFAKNGRIFGAENARIYTLLGVDVTNQNGNLKGVYVVKSSSFVEKIVVR